MTVDKRVAVVSSN